MAALLTTLLTWFTRFLIASFVVRIASLVTIFTISSSLLEFFLDEVFTGLAAFEPIAILQLAGIGEAICILGSAFGLRLIIDNVSIRPGTAILG